MKRLRVSLIAVLMLVAAMPLRAAPLGPEQQAAHVLNRVAFGPRPGDIERVARLGGPVLRRAAAMPIPLAEQETSEFQTADRVVRAAQIESAAWAARGVDAPTPAENTRAGTA